MVRSQGDRGGRGEGRVLPPLGVPLIDGGTVRLPRLIGMGQALDLILTGRPVGAEKALVAEARAA